MEINRKIKAVCILIAVVMVIWSFFVTFVPKNSNDNNGSNYNRVQKEIKSQQEFAQLADQMREKIAEAGIADEYIALVAKTPAGNDTIRALKEELKTEAENMKAYAELLASEIDKYEQMDERLQSYKQRAKELQSSASYNDLISSTENAADLKNRLDEAVKQYNAEQLAKKKAAEAARRNSETNQKQHSDFGSYSMSGSSLSGGSSSVSANISNTDW